MGAATIQERPLLARVRYMVSQKVENTAKVYNFLCFFTGLSHLLKLSLADT